MVALNSQVRIQNRTGGALTTISLEGWWSSFGASNILSPRVLYDPYGQRWIFTASADKAGVSGFVVAVSQTSDPTGTWNRYFISPIDHATGHHLDSDSPSVGFNTNRIVVQLNTFDGITGQDGTSIYAFSKTNLYAGGTGLNTFWSFQDVGDPTTDIGSQQIPAVTLDRNTTTNYLVQEWNGNYTEDFVNYFGYLRVYSISGPVGAETFNIGQFAAINDPWWEDPWGDGTPPADFGFLPQLGAGRIYAGDARIVNVVFRNSTLWAAHTVFTPAGASEPTRSAAQFWEITPGGTVRQQGRVEDTSGNYFYAYPSIAANASDDALVGYSRFSASEYPASFYSFRTDPDVLGTLRAEGRLKAGEGPYNAPDSLGIIGWGSYSASVIDPNNDADLWTIQEYAATPVSGSGRWGTWWGRVAPPVDLGITMTDSPHSAPVGGTLSYTLVVTNASTNRVTLASGVTLSDSLPAGVTFNSVSSSQGSCVFSGGVINCDLGNLPVRGRATVSILVTPNNVGQITNTTTVSANGQEINPVDNTATAITTVVPAADLAVSLFASPNPVTQTSNLLLTVLVTNQGPFAASAVTLTNTLPTSVTFVSATSSQGTNTRNANVITYTLGSLAIGASATANIQVSTPTAGLVTNGAIAVSSTADNNTNNNSGFVGVKINARPTIQTIFARSFNEDTSDSFAFTISDAETPASNLLVTATSANQALIPNSNLALTGTGSPRTLTITPLPNQFGNAAITLTVTDSDGVSASTTWTETVNPVNDPPTIDPISPFAVNEDSGARVVNLTGITSGAPNESDTLTVTASSSNTGIIPTPVVSYSSPNPTGTLTLTPVANAFGTVTITVTVNDNTGVNSITTRTFTVTVNPVNDPPTLNTPGPVTINEDAPQQSVSLSGIGAGAANETDTLSVTAVSSDTSIIPNPTVSYASPNTVGTLNFTPVPTRFGTVTISVTVNDNQPSNNIVTRNFSVTVNPVNDFPTLDTITNVNVNEDAPLQTINLTGISSGATNEFDTLTVTASSSNTNLIATPTVNYTSPNPTGTLNFTPTPTRFGSAIITVTVNDGQASNNIITRNFTITVNAVNDPPTLDPLGDVNLFEDAGLQVVSLTGITTGATNETDALTVTANSSNPSLIPNPTITYGSPNPTGTLQFTPVANGFGSATITVTVNDNQPSNNIVRQTFLVTVAPVNDPPTLNALSPVTINEDAPTQVVNLTGITTGATNEPDMLAVTASSSNPAIVPDPVVSYTSPNPTGSISFAPLPNASGSVTITVTVNDGQPSNNTITRTFTVTINPVNDPPTLNPITVAPINEDAGLQTMPLSGITSGAPNENQTLTITASNSNPALLTSPIVSYSSPSTVGSLSFGTISNANGSAVITVTVNDGGASNNITRQSFTVTVNPVNDPPTLSDFPDPSFTDEDVPLTLPFTVADVETPAASLVVFADSSNEELITTNEISFGGSGANRTVTLRPLSNQYGSSTITISVRDPDGGIASTFFELDVNPVNDAPTTSPLTNRVVLVNTPVTVAFTVDDVESVASDLIVSAQSTNQTLVPDANLVLGGSDVNRTLGIQPAADQAGTSLIRVIVTDGDAFTTNSFLLTVRTNEPPFISPISSQSIPEDTPGSIALTVGDAETGAGSLTLSGASSNPVLVPNGNIQFGGSGTARTLFITPATNQNGSATITVTVRDPDGLLATTSFLLTVTPVNDPPTIQGLADQTTNEDTPLAVPFVVGDVETAPGSITLSAASSNAGLVPVGNIVFSGSGANRMATITPAANQFGTTTITFNVNDGAATTSGSFILTVLSVNDLPTISAIANVAINEDTPSGAIAFTVGDIETPAGSLVVTGNSSNPALVPNSNIVLGGSGSSRTVTLTPAQNQFGATTITLTVTDANGGTNSTSFLLTVNPVNDPPTISSISGQTINEDSSVTLPFTINDVDTPVYALTVTAGSGNLTLLPQANILLDGYGTNRTVTLIPAANQSGTVTITLTVSDGLASASTAFVLTVNAVNDRPTLNPIANIFTNVSPGTITVNLAGITSGAANESQTLTVTVAYTNPGLYQSAPTVTYTSPSATGTLSFRPANTSVPGSSTITVTVSDGTLTTNQSFTLYVRPSGNVPPTITGLAAQTINEDTSTAAIPFTIADDTTPVSLLTLSTFSSNPALVPSGNIVLGGSGANRTVTVTPLANQFGTATITISLTDTNNGGTNSSFLLTVNSVNDAPVISAIPNQTINEDTSTGVIPFMIGDVETAAASLTVSGTSSNLTLVPTANIVFGGSGTNRALIITPATNQSGVSLITITVSDGAATRSTNFLLTVNPINDPPTITGIANQTIAEDSATAALAFTVGDLETAAGSLIVTGASSNQGLVPNSNIAFGGSGASRNVTITPAPDQFGSTTITLTVSDGAATTSTNFLLTVTPVNDPPTLDPLANITIFQSAGPQTVNLTGISAGPPNEIQILAVSAISSNPALIPNPSVSYTSPNTTGSVTLTPIAGTNGSAIITVTVNDGQSLNNLFSRSFTVTSTPAPPALSITQVGTNVIVFWPADATGFTLQGRDTLSPGDIWSPVNEMQVPSGGQIYVTNSLAPGSHFYRLSK
jgi:hypothetical protein